MRVAMVCPYDIGKPGGVQSQAIALVDWLAAQGHEAWLVAPGEGGPPGSITVGGTASIPANRSQAPVALDPRVGRRVVEAVGSADVVHIHEPFMPMVSAAALVRSDRPLVGTFHADPGAGVKGLYALARPLWRNWAERLAVATAVSPVAQAAVAPFVDARVVPNAIDAASYRLDVQRFAKRVGFVGRDEKRKGLDVLLAAWPLVRRRVPEAELVVGGADRTDVVAGVRFLGAMSDDAKRRLLASSAVYAAPNTGGESFGLVVAEAMAAGCAVVASALPAFAAVLGDTGKLVSPEEPSDLADSIAELLEDSQKAALLGERASSRAQRFDRSVIFPQYVAAFEQAAG